MPQPVSLILAAHGSEASPRSNQPLHDLAAALRLTGLFDHVTPAFPDGPTVDDGSLGVVASWRSDRDSGHDQRRLLS